MQWEKLGCIFAGQGQYPWLQTHASMPFAEFVKDDIYCIYFTPRDHQNRSYIASLEIDLTDPQEILHLPEEPVLKPGPLGAFDEEGVMGSWLLTEGDTRYLYYIGWSKPSTVPYHTAIGLAVSYQGKSFEKVEGPILERNPHNPFFVSTPCVLKEGQLWKMWYLSGAGWRIQDSRSPWSPYHICYAKSDNGIWWQPYEQPVLDFYHPNEIAIARPCVRPSTEGYEMWYSYRGTDFNYQIGYAISKDGLEWTRKDDQAGFLVSSEGWDSEMTAYPYLFDHRGQTYMLYCGNGFSQGGLGLARMVQP